VLRKQRTLFLCSALHLACIPLLVPDRVILVYDGHSGVRAMLLDVLRKAVGREDCPLCEITHGPLGKRDAWRRCERRLGVMVDALHRDQIPEAWSLSRAAVPCILGRVRDELPFVLVTRHQIEACGGEVHVLMERLQSTLVDPRGDR
jgi:hypothetical protein